MRFRVKPVLHRNSTVECHASRKTKETVWIVDNLGWQDGASSTIRIWKILSIKDFLKRIFMTAREVRTGRHISAHFRAFPFTGSNWISLSQSGHNASFYPLGHIGFPFYPSQNPIVWKKKKKFKNREAWRRLANANRSLQVGRRTRISSLKR